MIFEYPAVLIPDESGGFTAQCPDLPEAFSYGTNENDALEDLGNSIALALSSLIKRGLNIPEPSRREPGEYLCRMPLLSSVKISLLMAMKEQRLPNSSLAQHLGLDAEEVDELLDLTAQSDWLTMERALAMVGVDYQIRFFFDSAGHG